MDAALLLAVLGDQYMAWFPRALVACLMMSQFIYHLIPIMSYSAFKVTQLDGGQIVVVSINRPKALNAMNPIFFEEL